MENENRKKAKEFVAAIMEFDGFANHVYSERKRILTCLARLKSERPETSLRNYRIEVVYKSRSFSANGELMLEILEQINEMYLLMPTIEDVKNACMHQVKYTFQNKTYGNTNRI